MVRPSPIVTVVTPAYRAEGFIDETMRSVWAQDHRPLEHIVVEDCSPDRTGDRAEEVAERLRGPEYSVRVIRHETNLGTAGALNTGVAAAEGDYVAWLSADDLYMQPGKTRHQLAILQQDPSLTGVFDWRSYHGADADSAKKQVPFGWPLLMAASPRLWRMDPSSALLGLMFFNPINGTSILLRRSDFGAGDLFDTELGTFDQDADLWMRMSAAGLRLAGRRTAGTLYRTHPDQNSKNLEAMADGTSVSRIRILLALEQRGLLGPLLADFGPELWMAYASRLHRRRPSVVGTMTDLGLRSVPPGAARQALLRMQLHLTSSAEYDPQETERRLLLAQGLMGSPLFKDFVAELPDHP